MAARTSLSNFISHGNSNGRTTLQHQRHNVPLRGVKRSAEDDLADEQRLAKRLNLLDLEQKSKPWIAPCDSSTSPCPPGTPAQISVPLPPANTPATLPTRRGKVEEYMSVDDTPDKIFIHDLDQELADDDPDEGKLIFLPDIERHFNRIPDRLLRPDRVTVEDAEDGAVGNELVLYSVPSSLSVPPEKDSVRKAIIESRQRVAAENERRKNVDYEGDHVDDDDGAAMTSSTIPGGYPPDEDSMELD